MNNKIELLERLNTCFMIGFHQLKSQYKQAEENLNFGCEVLDCVRNAFPHVLYGLTVSEDGLKVVLNIFVSPCDDALDRDLLRFLSGLPNIDFYHNGLLREQQMANDLRPRQILIVKVCD